MQIHDRSGGSPALNDDLDLCISTGLKMLRTSMRMCPSHPVAFYAEGPRGCTSKRAQRISNDRVALAKWIAATATRKLEEEARSRPAEQTATVTESPRDVVSVANRPKEPLLARHVPAKLAIDPMPVHWR